MPIAPGSSARSLARSTPGDPSLSLHARNARGPSNVRHTAGKGARARARQHGKISFTHLRPTPYPPPTPYPLSPTPSALSDPYPPPLGRSHPPGTHLREQTTPLSSCRPAPLPSAGAAWSVRLPPLLAAAREFECVSAAKLYPGTEGTRLCAGSGVAAFGGLGS